MLQVTISASYVLLYALVGFDKRHRPLGVLGDTKSGTPPSHSPSGSREQQLPPTAASSGPRLIF